MDGFPSADVSSRAASSGPEESGLSLRQLPWAFRRHWLLFLLVAGSVVVLVMLATFLLPPSYESEASVRVRSDRAGMSEGLGGGAAAALEDALPMATDFSLPGLEGADVPTEIGVLGSRRILEAVIDSLALHVELLRPWREFRTDVLRVVEAGEDAPRGVYSLRLQGDGSYTASVRKTQEPVELPDRVVIGEPFRVGPMVLELETELAEDPPELVRFRVQPFRRVVRSIQREVRIDRDDAGSRLIVIKYRHDDPNLAQAMVNGMVGNFMDYSLSMSTSDPRREARILSEQVELYEGRLQEVENRLRAYQEQERLVAPQEQARDQVVRIAQIQVGFDAMEVEREALAELLRGVSEAGADTLGETPYRRLATFPSFITNNAVQQLMTTLTNLESQRSALLVRRTEENLDVRQIQDRIREVEEQILTLATDYLESLDTHLASAQRSLARFSGELEQIPAVELEYARLVRERRLLSDIYLTLNARLTEAQVQEVIEDAQIRVVDLGVVEDRPVFPRPEISLVLSMLLGLMLGTFAVVAAETTTPLARSRVDVEQVVGAPALGAIPHLPGQRRGKGPADPLVTRSDPWHAASEGFRGLALTLLARDPVPGVVVIASPGRTEGRSTVAANLATALAQQGRRVTLLDGDLRSGNVHEIFRVSAQPGWASAVVGGSSVDESVREVDLGGTVGGSLHVLPGGVVSSHPVEILMSDRFPAFLADLRERYDLVVIDTPSLEDGHEAAVLAGLADGVLLVSRSDRTRKQALADAAHAVRRARGKVLGVVLTDVKAGAKLGRVTR